MTDVSGNAEEERLSEFYNQPWIEEAVHRYFYRQVKQIKQIFFALNLFSLLLKIQIVS